MGWTMTLRLDVDGLRTMKIPLMLLNFIMEDKRLRAHKHNLGVILSELLSNALEWGVLRLDGGLKNDAEGFEQYFEVRQKGLNSLTDGWIKIELEHVPMNNGGKFVVWVEDSGPGFDYQNLGAFFDDAVYGGRGIYLVRGLCENVRLLRKWESGESGLRLGELMLNNKSFRGIHTFSIFKVL